MGKLNKIKTETPPTDLHRSRNEQECKCINVNFSYHCQVVLSHYLKSIMDGKYTLAPSILSFLRFNAKSFVWLPSQKASSKRVFAKINSWQADMNYYFDSQMANDMNTQKHYFTNV